jgi:xanthine dehydrogenase/oxidase
LNQGACLVNIYTDGSVSISIHAVEMGQGIHAKCAQVAARCLGVSVDTIRLNDTSSAVVPNTPPTAASMGSDLACTAVIDACEQLQRRLAGLREEIGRDLPFRELCAAAFLKRVHLSATGYFRTPVGGMYDWDMKTSDNSKRGQAFAYHTFGVGVSEVEMDVLTGQYRVLRTDLLMDTGCTLNAGIDIGQIEGAFMQGLGWLTTEELIFGDREHPHVPPGVLQNASPHGYYIPTAHDVPLDFRVALLSGAPNPFAVHGSKAVGEPPLYLAASAYFALKNAIYDARQCSGLEGYLPLGPPLTPEKVRMACRDQFTGGEEIHKEFHVSGSW